MALSPSNRLWRAANRVHSTLVLRIGLVKSQDGELSGDLGFKSDDISSLRNVQINACEDVIGSLGSENTIPAKGPI